MEKLNFDFTKYPEREDQLNIIATFIVNRAARFDTMKYNRIVIELYDDPISCTAYNFILIISNATSTPVYCNWKGRKARFTNPKSFKFRPQFWLDWIKKKEDTLYLDCISTTSFELSTNYPKIFSGFSKQEIEEIAEKLYGWQDDLPSYKAWKRSLKDARNNNQW